MSNINNDSNRIRSGQNRLQQPAQVQKRSSGVVQTDKKISEAAPRKLSGAKSIQEGRVKSVKAELKQLKTLASGSEKTEKAQTLATKINGYLNNNRFFGKQASDEDKGAFFKFARDLRGLQNEALKLTEGEAAFGKSEVIGRKRAKAFSKKTDEIVVLRKSITSKANVNSSLKREIVSLKKDLKSLSLIFKRSGNKPSNRQEIKELKGKIADANHQILENSKEILSDVEKLENRLDSLSFSNKQQKAEYEQALFEATTSLEETLKEAEPSKTRDLLQNLTAGHIEYAKKNYGTQLP